MSDEVRVIRIVVDSSRAVDGSAAATRAYERMEKAQRDVSSSLDRMEKALGRVAGFLKAQLALVIGEIGARLLQMSKDAVESASGLDELSEQLGITTRGLQALQFSAVQNGVKLEQLETGISKFSQKIGEAAGGSKEMLEALNAMGVRILDLNGKLRPTETLMQEVAAGILAIDDPARRSATAVDFFGKAGTKFLPVLQDMAKGLDALGAAAERNGAMIEDRVVKRLDAYGDSVAKQQLRTRALLATYAADILEYADKADARMRQGHEADTRRIDELMQSLSGIGDAFRTMADESVLVGGRFVVTFLAYFRSLPEELPKLFVDAMNASIEAIETGLNKIGTTISTKFPWLAGKAGITGDIVSFGRLSGGGASTASERFAAAGQAGATWEAGKRAEFSEFYARQKAERDRAGLISRQAGYASDEDAARAGKLGAVDGGGRSNPSPKGAGDDVMDRMRKALQDSGRELEQAKAFADAAGQGADAVARLEVHFKALKTAQDVFGKAANDNARGVAELTAKLEEQALATQRLKNLGDFQAATEALRDQNELLEAEVRLANELPEVRARELAILKTMQDVKAKGLEGETTAIERRREAIEQNERLKAQGEEIRRSNELWTEPFKSALQSIQQRTTDWIDGLLEGLEKGKFSLEDFGKMGTAILRRMVAEIMSLAIIRPMLGSVVGGLSSMGIVSPSMASSLGYGNSTGGGAGIPSMGGGSGGGSLFGGSDFFSRPIASLFPSATPAGGFSDVGALLQSGQTGASASASGIGGLGGMSIGQGLGGLAGIGMGAYQLANAKGNTGKTIAGIGSMVGGAVSMIPGLQPVGMAISMLSQLAPALFGEPDTRTHSSTNASLRYGAGGYGTSGGAWGPGANVSQSQSALGQVGANVSAVYDLFGGVKDASKVWGMDLSSWTASGKDWSYTSNATHLVDPSGNRSAWRMNEGNMVDTASAQVAMRSILGGAVGTITENMRTAVTAMLPATTTLQDVAKGVSFVTDTYEKLGKTVVSIEPDFEALQKQFKDMASTATSLGLSLDPVTAEQKKKTARLAQDYIDDLIDPIALALRQFADEKATILANVDYLKDHTDVVVDMARVNEALLRKEAALKEQLYGGAISQLQDAINRLLPGGNLANLDPSGTLAGMKASYQATYAQAAAGDAAAIGRFGGEAASFAEYAKGYYAGSPEYNALKLQIIEALQTVQATVQGPVTASDTGTAIAATNATNAQMQQLMATVQNLVVELQAERAETAKLRAVLSRYVTTQAA